MTYGMHQRGPEEQTLLAEVERMRSTLAMIGLQAGLALTMAEDPAVRRVLLRITDLANSCTGVEKRPPPGYPAECPKCHTSLIGQPIYQSGKPSPEHGGATHFSRAIACVDRELDRATHWLCPDCCHKWDRS